MDLVEIMKDFGQYGIFAGLFIWLLFYVLKKNDENLKKIMDESSKREEKLYCTITDNQNIIRELTRNFDILKIVETDVREIKDRVNTYARSDDK